ncbi:MAG: divalent metal cation transporter, partial [Phycisphaerae bacterium]
LITLAILVTAAGCFERGTSIDGAAAMAKQLEPVLGRSARVFFAAGLFAAGLTSAVTAPLAAAYAATGILGLPSDRRSTLFRVVGPAIVLIGVGFALIGGSPVQAIVFAQAANGMLLPLLAVILMIVMNRRNLLGEWKNAAALNVLGGGIVLVATGLGVFQLMRVVGVFSN